MLKYSGYDAYELLRMSYRHESILDMLRLFLGCEAYRAAGDDPVKRLHVDQIDHDCKECLDGSFNTQQCANPAVKDAFDRLFSFLDITPAVMLELQDEPPFLAQAEQSLKTLAKKSGVKFEINYPGKV
jgi:hypothetical protein